MIRAGSAHEPNAPVVARLLQVSKCKAMTIGTKNFEGPQLSEGRDGDCLETRAAGRLQFAEVARSSTDKSEEAQRANKEDSYNRKNCLPTNTSAFEAAIHAIKISWH